MVKGKEFMLPTALEKEDFLNMHYSQHHIQSRPWFLEVYDRERFYWPKMFEEFANVVKGCASCQGMSAFPTGKKMFQNLPEFAHQLQLDHHGPYHDEGGVKFWILTTTERFTGRLTAHVVASTMWMTH